MRGGCAETTLLSPLHSTIVRRAMSHTLRKQTIRFNYPHHKAIIVPAPPNHPASPHTFTVFTLAKVCL